MYSRTLRCSVLGTRRLSQNRATTTLRHNRRPVLAGRLLIGGALKRRTRRRRNRGWRGLRLRGLSCQCLIGTRRRTKGSRVMYRWARQRARMAGLSRRRCQRRFPLVRRVLARGVSCVSILFAQALLLLPPPRGLRGVIAGPVGYCLAPPEPALLACRLVLVMPRLVYVRMGLCRVFVSRRCLRVAQSLSCHAAAEGSVPRIRQLRV